MPQMTVHCTVSNCHYWKSNNLCDASEILIATDNWAAQAPDRIDAMQASTLSQDSAHTCMDTCCKTFVPKGSQDRHQDSIIRQ